MCVGVSLVLCVPLMAVKGNRGSAESIIDKEQQIFPDIVYITEVCVSATAKIAVEIDNLFLVVATKGSENGIIVE